MNQATKRLRTVRRIVELLRAGLKNRAIARELQVSRDRVAQVREQALHYGYLGVGVTKPLPPFPALIFPDEVFVDGRTTKTSDADLRLAIIKPWIEERFAANWKPITIFEELPIKNITRSSFYRFLNRHDLLKCADHQTLRDRRITPIIHQPGEALLLDWGKVRDVFDVTTGKKKTLWGFVGVLGYSRLMAVRFVWTNDIPTTIAALESILRELGGVPTRLTSDNPKCFATEASRFEPLLNPVLERFAAHYNTVLECLPPEDPQKKGKVERLMPFVRRLFEAYGNDWISLEHAQTYINKKCAIANERVHGTTRKKPIEEFVNLEAAALKPLPALAFEIEEFSEAKVRRDGFVRFKNKHYAVADQFIGQTVHVLGSKTSVSIFHKGKLLENYTPITNPHEYHATKDHLKKSWELLIADHGHYLKRASALGPNTVRFVQALLEKNLGFVDTRKIWGILSLDKTHAPAAIDEACRMALAMNSLSFRTVQSILQLGSQKKTKKDAPARTPECAPIPTPKFAVSINDYQQQMDLLN
jgi:hypothetical protein